LTASLSRLLRVKTWNNGPDLGVRAQQISFEQKIAFVIEVNETVHSAVAIRLKDELLDQLRILLLSKKGNKDHLVFLFQKIAAFEKDENKLTDLLNAAKAYLLDIDEGCDLDDFEAVGEFANAFPEIVQSHDLEHARVQFRKVL